MQAPEHLGARLMCGDCATALGAASAETRRKRGIANPFIAPADPRRLKAGVGASESQTLPPSTMSFHGPSGVPMAQARRTDRSRVRSGRARTVDGSVYPAWCAGDVCSCCSDSPALNRKFYGFDLRLMFPVVFPPLIDSIKRKSCGSCIICVCFASRHFPLNGGEFG